MNWYFAEEVAAARERESEQRARRNRMWRASTEGRSTTAALTKDSRLPASESHHVSTALRSGAQSEARR